MSRIKRWWESWLLPKLNRLLHRKPPLRGAEYELTLHTSVVSQDVEANTTTIAWSLHAARKGEYASWSPVLPGPQQLHQEPPPPRPIEGDVMVRPPT